MLSMRVVPRNSYEYVIFRPEMSQDISGRFLL